MPLIMGLLPGVGDGGTTVGVRVAVGGTGVAVGGTGVAVPGIPVDVRVAVGGTSVGVRVAVGGRGVAVGGTGVGVAPVQAAGKSNAAVPSVRLLDEPWLALLPKPRRANAAQIRHWFAPPVKA